MGTEQGRDTRLYVETAADTFTKIGGETTFSYSPSSPEIDTSDKDGGSGTYGQRMIGISVSGNTKLPDAGLTALHAASKANPPEIFVKIMKGSIVRFHGLVGVSALKADFPIGVATWSCDLKNAAVPIVDDIFSLDD